MTALIIAGWLGADALLIMFFRWSRDRDHEAERLEDEYLFLEDLYRRS